MPKKFLIRHLGNMGDLVFFVPPLLQTLKRRYPDCHITFVTVWGFKDKQGRWGKRNGDGFSIHLLMTNPHIDQLVHWHDTALSLDKKICYEDGQNFPTWNKSYYEEQKKSKNYDSIFELDFGLKLEDNPIQRIYEKAELSEETYTDYKLYFTEQDLEIAKQVMAQYPHPRIFLLESIEGKTTRGWDPNKIPALEKKIYKTYGVPPIWFGSRHVPLYHGQRLTLRENIACLKYGDVGIGVMSGPLHFAAAVGLPTLTLFCDHPLHRAAPAFFLNPYIVEEKKKHRTLLGPDGPVMHLLKNDTPSELLTPLELRQQHFKGWLNPGRQATKTCLSVITVEEVMTVLSDMLYDTSYD